MSLLSPRLLPYFCLEVGKLVCLCLYYGSIWLSRRQLISRPRPGILNGVDRNLPDSSRSKEAMLTDRMGCAVSRHLKGKLDVFIQCLTMEKHRSGLSRTPTQPPSIRPRRAPLTPSPMAQRTPPRAPSSHQLVLLGPLLGPPQLPHPLVARVPVDDPPAVDEALGPARVLPLADLALAVEVGPRDVEAVDVAGDHAAEQPHGVDEGVHAYTGHEHDGEGRHWREVCVSGGERTSFCLGLGGRRGWGRRLTEAIDDCEQDALREHPHVAMRGCLCVARNAKPEKGVRSRSTAC